METYLVKIYFRNIIGKTEHKDFVYRCEEKDLEKYIRQETKILESSGENVAKGAIIYLYKREIEL